MDEVTVSIGSGGFDAYQWVTLAVGTFLTLVNVFLTVYNSNLARKRSVEDEFWFRRVVAPAVIDGSQIFAARWCAELARASDIKGDVEETKRKVAQCKSECSDLVSAFMCLKLYEGNHYVLATGHIDEMVDAVTNGLYVVSNDAIEGQELARAIDENREDVQKSLIAIFGRMKEMQSKF